MQSNVDHKNILVLKNVYLIESFCARGNKDGESYEQTSVKVLDSREFRHKVSKVF